MVATPIPSPSLRLPAPPSIRWPAKQPSGLCPAPTLAKSRSAALAPSSAESTRRASTPGTTTATKLETISTSPRARIPFRLDSPTSATSPTISAMSPMATSFLAPINPSSRTRPPASPPTSQDTAFPSISARTSTAPISWTPTTCAGTLPSPSVSAMSRFHPWARNTAISVSC